MYQTGESLFRAVQLSLLIWLHCLLLLRVHVALYEIAAHIDLFCVQAYDGNFPITRGLVLLLNLRTLTALELGVLNLVFLLLRLELLLPLHLDSSSNLSLVFMLHFVWTATVHLNDGQFATLALTRRVSLFLLKPVEFNLAVAELLFL